MRIIGTLSSREHALKFSDYLLVQGIENKIEKEDDGQWSLWCRRDEQLPEAVDEFQAFVQDPDSPRYQKATRGAEEIRSQTKKAEKQHRSNFVDIRTHWHQRGMAAMGPVTMTLLILSVLVFLATYLGGNQAIASVLFIDSHRNVGLRDVLSGQVWRLVTPIFLHFGWLHIIFNMLWTKDLGGMLEYQKGSLYLGAFVIVTAVLSNLAQYLVSGPTFGGMSGVVYGLLGFVWMKSRYDPTDNFYLPKEIVIMMIVWFFICLVGIIPNIANMAHGVGLAVGMIWGLISARIWRRLG